MIAFAFLAPAVADAQSPSGGNTGRWPRGHIRIQEPQGQPLVPCAATQLQDAPTGGVQLDIDPRSAEVYVDGRYAGVVGDFSGYYKHLEVPAGPHLITIIARDYEPWIISMMVVPGRTRPIRGTLSRAHGR